MNIFVTVPHSPNVRSRKLVSGASAEVTFRASSQSIALVALRAVIFDINARRSASEATPSSTLNSSVSAPPGGPRELKHRRAWARKGAVQGAGGGTDLA